MVRLVDKGIMANLHLAIISVGFGSAMLFTHVAVAGLPVLWVASGRSIIAMVILGILALARGELRHIRWVYVPQYVLLGMLTGAIPYLSLAWSQRHIPSSLGGIIFAASPLLVLLLGTALFGERKPSVRKLAGATVGLGGVALALPFGETQHSLEIWAGLLTLLAAASYALGALCIQRMRLPGILSVSFAQLVSASLFLATCAILFSESPLAGVAVEPILNLAALGGLSTALPVASFFALVPIRGAAFASLSTFFIPFVAVGLGTVLLGERISALAIMGFVLAVAGSYLISSRPASGNHGSAPK